MAKKPLILFSNAPIPPKCLHFGSCGGCLFQHVPYQDQVVQKQNFIKNLFGLEPDPIISCEPHWGYRNKMEFSFSEAKDGKKFLGLFQKGARGRVVQLEECFLTGSWFLDALKKVYEWWQRSGLKAYRPFANEGLLRTLTLREGVYTGEKMLVLTISGNECEVVYPFLEEFTKLFEECDSLILRKQFVQKKVPTRFVEETLLGKSFIYECLQDEEGKKWKFKIRPSSFFQPNTHQASLLLQQAVKHIEGGTVFDLYCGTGSIGIFASSKATKVVGIEIVPDSIRDAKDNMEENKITNMEVVLGDVEKELVKIPTRPDTVIVDPPRAGLTDKTIEILKEIGPKKIIYISCNPVSQVENCVKLGYKILSLQPVDQFPHTPHIENIAILVS